jgi:NAD(P)H-quinone oxidoreductase subunit 4L
MIRQALNLHSARLGQTDAGRPVLASLASGSEGGSRTVIVNQFLIISAALFALGVYGLLVRRNIVLILLSVELMLNAVNINFVAFEAMLNTSEALGQVFAIFVITVAAAEVGIGLAIVLMIFRNRRSANVDELNLMRW